VADPVASVGDSVARPVARRLRVQVLHAPADLAPVQQRRVLVDLVPPRRLVPAPRVPVLPVPPRQALHPPHRWPVFHLWPGHRVEPRR
jgi:hypothetical protein